MVEAEKATGERDVSVGYRCSAIGLEISRLEDPSNVLQHLFFASVSVKDSEYATGIV